MTWKFTIIQGAFETELQDEPPGWASIDKTLQRDPETHGMVFNFSVSSLEFIEEAYWILKEEYLLKGVDGDIGLRIEWLCDDCEGWQLFYDGKMDFNRYSERCGDDCSISIGLQASNTEVLIKNRMDTDVDLTRNLAYDNTTVLTDYPYLNRDLQVPSKAILIQAKAINEQPLESENLREDQQWYANTSDNTMLASVIPGFTRTIATDLDTTVFFDSIQLLNGGRNNRPEVGMTPMVDVKEFSKLSCISSEAEIKYRFKGSINQSHYTNANLKMFLLPFGVDPGDAAGYVTLADHEIPQVIGIVSFDFGETIPINLKVGDRLFMFVFLNVRNPEDTTTFVLTEDPECYIDISLKSICDPTPAKTYYLHEAASRVIEHITNNRYRFYSAYYGRVNSMPYSFVTNGCGGLRTLTNGLQLRRAVLQDGSEPKAFISLKTLFESLNAIDCIGMGIEGTNVIFEPVRYFYRDEIIFVCDGVRETTTVIRNEKIYNQFSFGYDKYETESTNGLDAIHTKRQYRLQIQNTDNKLEKYSKIIADGYATEVTRRKFGTSEDWRYDQNIFLLCLHEAVTGDFLFTGFVTHSAITEGIMPGDKLTISGSKFNDGVKTVDFTSDFGGNGNYAIYFVEPVTEERNVTISIGGLKSPIYGVEQGNIESPEHIFDPATVINYSVSPLRNAMRWFRWITQGYRTNVGMTFNSGDGNYVAKGKQTTGCINEAYAMAENSPITTTDFLNQEETVAYIVPEKVSFTFPMGLNEFVEISAKKYGKIQYRRYEDEDWRFGWIDTLRYSPNDGEAEFTLISAISGDAVQVLLPPAEQVTFDTILTFDASNTDLAEGVRGTVGGANAVTEFQFNRLAPTGLPLSMTITISGTEQMVVDYPGTYLGKPFRYISPDGTQYMGNFVNGINNL